MSVPPNASSEQELLQLRNEGKITDTEYQELLAAMRKPPPPDQDSQDMPGSCSASQLRILKSRSIPPILYVGLVSLALMVVGKVLGALQFGPFALVDAALSAALLVGLYLGHKWAYVATIVLVALGVVLAGSKSIGYALAVLLVNGLVLVPMILSRDYFFPKSTPSGGN